MRGKNLSGSRTKFEISLQIEVYLVATIHNIQKMLLFGTVQRTKVQKAQMQIFFPNRIKMFL